MNRIITAAALIVATASAGFAQGQVSGQVGPPDTYSWHRMSPITLGPPQEVGATATVTFYNQSVHGDSVEFFVLTFEGLTVNFEVEVGRGMTPDELCVYPPAGMVAVPECITVPEDETGMIHLYWMVS